jgi:hypothetical protein
MTEDPKVDGQQNEEEAEAPDGGPLHGGADDPLGAGVEQAEAES